MKKIIAIVLGLLVACVSFACLVSAEGEQPTADPYDHDIPQIVTDLMGHPDKTYNDEIHDGFKFFRILTENLSKFFQDIARAFDNFIDRVHAFRVDNLGESIKNMFS